MVSLGNDGTAGQRSGRTTKSLTVVAMGSFCIGAILAVWRVFRRAVLRMSQSEYICSGLCDLEVKLEKSLAPTIRFGECWFWTLTLTIDLRFNLFRCSLLFVVTTLTWFWNHGR
jgi:hypothetical protein